MSTRTNFVTIEINSNILNPIFSNNLKDFFQDCRLSQDDTLVLTMENVEIDVPRDKNEIVDSLILFLQMNCENSIQVCKCIYENKNMVLDSISYFRVELVENDNNNQDKSKYYEDSYSKKTLKKIKKAVAKELGCSVKKVTYEDFCDYVACVESRITEIYVYDKINNNNKYKRNFTLNIDDTEDEEE